MSSTITNGATETITMHGLTYMTVNTGGSFEPNDPSVVTVNLAANSKWIGSFHEAGNGHLTIEGAGQFYNDYTSTANGTTLIKTNVIGAGTINEYQSHSAPGKLEFMHGVAAGQIVSSSGYELYGGEFGKVQVDDPAAYHASNILGFGEFILEGLKATSYSLKPDLLSLYKGNTLIYQTRLAFTTPPVSSTFDDGNARPTNFGVSQVGNSVVIHADGYRYSDGGSLLPTHA